MTTLEQFKAQQAKDLEAFFKKQDREAQIIATGIPKPDYIGGDLFGAQSITYHNQSHSRTLQEALEHFKFFNIVPFNVLKSETTILFPEKHLQEKEKEKGYKLDSYKTQDYAVQITVGFIKDSPANTFAKLKFFALHAGVLLNVTIEFGTGYIGSCERLRPKTVESYNGNRTESRSYYPNEALNGMADSVLSYGSGYNGPMKTSADHRYLFMAEQEAPLPGNECRHALASLYNVSACMGEQE